MLEAIDLDRIRSSIQEIYRELEQELARRSPVCAISGRCCRFKEYGHTLFLSEPEASLLCQDAPPPVRALDDGQTCPWQDLAGRCTARDARPLGCRLYYCDPTFEDEMPELSERYLGRLKALVNQFDLPWNYAPVHHHLRQILTTAPEASNPAG